MGEFESLSEKLARVTAECERLRAENERLRRALADSALVPERNSLHLPANAPAARTPPYAAAALTHVILHHCVAAAKGVLGFQPVPDPIMLQPIRGLAVRISCPVGQFMSDSGV